MASEAPVHVAGEVEALLERKRNTAEFGTGPRNDILNTFIFGELERHGAGFAGLGRPKENSASKLDALNAVFRSAVSDV